MAFIDYILKTPAYGWQNETGELTKPSTKELWSELFHRINIFKSKKNWITLIGWFWVLCMLPIFILFFVKYFTFPLFILGFFYGMFIMSTHGTIWYHRYCTHRAYKFSNKFWKFITQNLVIKVIPEEIYVVSHHVHHLKSDRPGDPYNTKAGFLYCFLADTNHQSINTNLNEEDYKKVSGYLNHTGIKINSYKEYQKWGSIANPWNTFKLWIGNWAFWYITLYLIGGHALACAIFSGAMIWVVGVRTFNYNGHGNGEDKRVEGTDFNNKDMSVNQIRPGLLSGEWHNNHHLYPNSAQSGFLPFQLDSAWYYIYFLYKIGGVSSYQNSKKEFYTNYYLPYKLKNDAGK